MTQPISGHRRSRSLTGAGMALGATAHIVRLSKSLVLARRPLPDPRSS
jgi:hypothetical protein